MNTTGVIPRVVPLLTKEDGHNHYWDTTFSFYPTFKGNSNGQYTVTVNEALFNNTEPFIKKDDYFQFNVYTTHVVDGETKPFHKFVWKVRIKREYYLYNHGSDEWTMVVKLLVGSLGGGQGQPLYRSTMYQECIRERWVWNETVDPVTGKVSGKYDLEHTYVETDGTFSMKIRLLNDNGTAFNGTNRGVNPIMFYDVYDIQLGDGMGDISNVELTYSWGYAYIVNNRADLIEEITSNEDKPALKDQYNESVLTTYDGHHFFEFCSLRLGGPYAYILEMTSLKTDVLTMNEANQCYNVTGMARNVADNHNETVQFISSMRGKASSLSNFRVRLLDDNFQPVKIRSPLWVQITITNDED